MDEREDVIAIAKKYLELVKASDFPMQIDKAYVFGSFANGYPHKDSDIDVALVVNRWDGDYFDVVRPIWKLRKKVDLRIEPHIIDPETDFSGFLMEVQRTGIEI